MNFICYIFSGLLTTKFFCYVIAQAFATNSMPLNPFRAFVDFNGDPASRRNPEQKSLISNIHSLKSSFIF